MAGGNVDDGHHPVAAGRFWCFAWRCDDCGAIADDAKR